jgi:23S rRNA pseudouridine1911/1915/1917 synthase
MTDQAGNDITPMWRVTAALAGVRLDAFVRRHLPHLSRRVIERSIEEKLFCINGKAGRKGDALADADCVTFCGPPLWLAPTPTPNASLQLSVVYEDEFLLALDKPAGMATHGFSARDTDTLANYLTARYPGLAGIGKTPWEPGIVHRLDRETSGLVLVAKTAAAFAQLRLQFNKREIIKRYWALVWGDLPAEGTIDYPIAHDPGDVSKMHTLVGAAAGRKKIKSWPALTSYRRLQSRSGMSLVELCMQTGVTHQLRVHLAAIGHPILGDRLYGSAGQETLGLSRQFLHAKELALRHPQDGRMLRLEAALSAELTAVLTGLKMKC